MMVGRRLLRALLLALVLFVAADVIIFHPPPQPLALRSLPPAPELKTTDDATHPESATQEEATTNFSPQFPHDSKFRFALDVSRELSSGVASLVLKGPKFTANVLSQLGNVTTPFPGEECSYVGAGRKHLLKPVEYSHRRKRKHEYSQFELFEVVKKNSGSRGFFQFYDDLPSIVNHDPVQLSPLFNISKPFGGWSSAFFPTEHVRSVAKYVSPQLVPPQPPLFAATFPRAVVSHGHVVTCDGSAYTAGGCLWDFHMPVIRNGLDVAHFPIAVALCDEWCKGYYHFTHEHLPRLALVHDLLLSRSDVKLVLSHAPTRFQTQFIVEILGIPPDRIVYGQAVYGTVVVYPMPMRCGNTFTHLLYMLREIAFQRLSIPVSNATRRWRMLFAERRKLSRMPSNYAQIKLKLTQDFKDDFEFETTLGESDAKHQVQLFHSADVVLGPHGANIANMMWMKPGSHVLEMASWRKGNMCYYTTAARINVTHHLILHDKSKDSVYELEYLYVKKHVDYALELLRRPTR